MKTLKSYYEVAAAFILERQKWFIAGPLIIAALAVGSWFAVTAVISDDVPLSGPGTSASAAPAPVQPTPASAGPTPARAAAVVDAGEGKDAGMDAAVPKKPLLQVPITLEGASDLGSVEFVLVFEPTALKFVGAEPGALAQDALIQTHLRSDGHVWVGVVDPNGVTGDGSIATLNFETLEGGENESPLTLQDVSTHQASTYLDSLHRQTPGIASLNEGLLEPPKLVFY